MHTPEAARYIPANTNQGWGIAGLVVALAVACIAGAWYVHGKTYKHPTDVTWHSPAASKGGASH